MWQRRIWNTANISLKKIGKEKTRLDMVFRNKWKNGRSPSRAEFETATKTS